MYHGIESLILDHVVRTSNTSIHAQILEPGRQNDYRGRVIVQHDHRGKPTAITIKSPEVERIMQFLVAPDNSGRLADIIANV